jgi:hypothetical protein
MDYWPLLDLRDAVQDCDALLAAIVADVETLHAESEGHFPPAAADVLANVAAIRALLTDLFPPALKQAIAEEKTVCDVETARWEPTNY